MMAIVALASAYIRRIIIIIAATKAGKCVFCGHSCGVWRVYVKQYKSAGTADWLSAGIHMVNDCIFFLVTLAKNPETFILFLE
jgi:hypothetical protein